MQRARKILILAAAGLALAQPLRAVPITGSIAFGGTVNLDGTTVSNSSHVNSWGAVNSVNTAFGSFAGLSGQSVNLGGPWSFYSGSLNNFWNVGGFQFNLSSSSVFDDFNGLLTVVFAGTVTCNSYAPTAFTGRVKIKDPASAGGAFTYTESLDFVTVPDGGTTALLLGLSLSALALIRRKTLAA